MTRSTGDGVYYIHIQARDTAGNKSDIYTYSAILDNTTPQGSIKINNDDAAVNSQDVILNLSAADETSSQDSLDIRYKNDSGSWTDWESYPVSNEKSWTLSDGNGDKVVYIQVKDEAGNIYSSDDTINYENSVPEITTDAPETTTDMLETTTGST